VTGTSTPTVTVVGGGPAGLIAAQVLAEAGASVTVHEHMASVGRKLLLAGRGGLNLTHTEPTDDFVARYGPAGAQLGPTIRAFGPAELRAWARDLGEATFVGSTGRVFPASFRATPLLRSWLRRLRELKVTIVTRDRWAGWATGPGGAVDPCRCLFVGASGNSTRSAADMTLLALGGASWPRVGSDGGWVDHVRRVGVDVRPLEPSNAGVIVAWTAQFAARFAGVPLKNVAVDAGNMSVRGDVMITDGGLEGGPVYAQSPRIRQALARDGCCTLRIDLHPDLSAEALTERLRRRRPKESMATLLRRTTGLAPAAVGLLHEATGRRLPIDAHDMAQLVKAVPLTVGSIMPLARAISSAGGIALSEIDERFMLRRLPGAFVAGEMLDWDAPTGGYLLQASFSTGVAAARGGLDWLARQR
jgi:uncharacterized flavoprotein (TIGR03862 family)